MNKTKKVTHKNKRKSNKIGGKKRDCKTKCKSDFLNEIHQNKKYKMMKMFASFFTKKDIVEEETKLVLNRKDIQNDKVFKDCIKTCKKI